MVQMIKDNPQHSNTAVGAVVRDVNLRKQITSFLGWHYTFEKNKQAAEVIRKVEENNNKKLLSVQTTPQVIPQHSSDQTTVSSLVGWCKSWFV